MNYDFLSFYTVFIFGLIIGSFLNVVISRLPNNMNIDSNKSESKTNGDSVFAGTIWWGRSKCPHCNAVISIKHNIPVLSYILLKGKCSDCQNKISIQYLIVELLTAICFCFLFYISTNIAQLAFIIIFSAFLISLTMIDINKMILPDQLTLPLLWIGLLANTDSLFIDLEHAVMGAVVGYSALWSLFWLFKLLTGRNGMGYGDFKLLAALGAWLGWQSIPSILLVASIMGITYGVFMKVKTDFIKNEFAFGPFLAIAGWVTMITKINDNFSFPQYSLIF